MVLIETKLRDTIEWRAIADAEAARRGISLRVLSCCRPASHDAAGELNDPSGGILVLILNPHLAISEVWDDKKGILSFSAKLPYAARICCVGSYLPRRSVALLSMDG